jgi:hypothetical protein
MSALFERMQEVDEFAEDLERLATGIAFDKYGQQLPSRACTCHLQRT